MGSLRRTVLLLMLLFCLVYETPAQTLEGGQSADAESAATPAVDLVRKPPDPIVVPAGTKLALVLTSAVTTRTAKPGDPVYFETSYYVTPEQAGERAYALLYRALQTTGLVAKGSGRPSTSTRLPLDSISSCCR